MLLGALNDYKHPGSFTYDAPGIYNTLTMMQTEHHPKCLSMFSHSNAPMRENKMHHLSFELYTHYYYKKNTFFIKCYSLLWMIRNALVLSHMTHQAFIMQLPWYELSIVESVYQCFLKITHWCVRIKCTI